MKIKPLLSLICSITLLAVSLLYAADKKSLLRELKAHKARSPSTWSELTGKGIADRVLVAPDIVLDYLRKDNQLQGYQEQPKKPLIAPGFYSDIVSAVLELPPAVMNHVHNHLVAVFFG